MKPILLEKLQQAVPNLGNHELEELVNSSVDQMANCQLSAIKHYPKKYWNRIVLSVANGKSFVEASESFDDFVMANINSGQLSLGELTQMVETGKVTVERCLQRN